MVRSTAPALPPAPPNPPIPIEAVRLELLDPGADSEMPPVTLSPPAPPPPPTLCATMPFEPLSIVRRSGTVMLVVSVTSTCSGMRTSGLEPVAKTLPVTARVTLSAVPPDPPKPPRPKPKLPALPFRLAEMPPEMLIAPLPPLPPTLCAVTPSEERPPVKVSPMRVRSTVPALPPPPPKSADADRSGARVAERQAERARDVDRAVAAAACEALCHHRVRIGARGAVDAGERACHLAAVAARAAEPADADRARQRRAVARRQRQRAGDVERTVAAGTARALQQSRRTNRRPAS